MEEEEEEEERETEKIEAEAATGSWQQRCLLVAQGEGAVGHRQ